MNVWPERRCWFRLGGPGLISPARPALALVHPEMKLWAVEAATDTEPSSH